MNQCLWKLLLKGEDMGGGRAHPGAQKGGMLDAMVADPTVPQGMLPHREHDEDREGKINQYRRQSDFFSPLRLFYLHSSDSINNTHPCEAAFVFSISIYPCWSRQSKAAFRNSVFLKNLD